MRVLALLIGVAALAGGCRDNPRGEVPPNPAAGSPGPGKIAAPVSTASAEVHGTSSDGKPVHGKITLVEQQGKVRITGVVNGLEPGQHGFHIHENGKCEGPSFESAGDHFNPAEAKHAGPQESPRHAGDLGNLVADRSRKAEYEASSTDITLEAGKHSVVGKSIVIHAKPDDLKSQPAGASGKRVACGVIQPPG